MAHQRDRMPAGRLGLLVAAAALSGLTACTGEPAAPSGEAPIATEDAETLIEDGRTIVEAQCASCHAIGAADDSPRMDAPPLRTVLAAYDPDALADDFREHIHVGHPDMPDFDFGPKGVDAVLAYLVSINPERGAP